MNFPFHFITHLLAVAALVGECEGTGVKVIVGLLPDAVQDQGGTKTLTEITE